jgi:hypothetical protein
MSENMISKIKIGNIEYELGTTIDNVSGLQNVLDDKATENFVLNKIAEAKLAGDSWDGITSTNVIHGNEKTLLSTIIDDYILSINYEILAFNTDEIVVGNGVSSPILGTGMLGYMVLA